MKKNLSIFSAVLIILGLTACSQILENGQSSAQTQKSAYIMLSFENTARTVLPELDITELTDIVIQGDLKGTPTSHFKQSFQTQEAARTTGIVIEPGTWDFTLSSKKGSVVYIASINDKEISDGENVLSFELELYTLGSESGTGDISITLTLPANSGVDGVQAGLFDIETDEEIEGFEVENLRPRNNAVTYTAEAVPTGNYRFKVFLYADDSYVALINTYRELVTVAEGCTSSAARTLTNLNEVYEITYEKNGGTISTAYAAPEVYTRSSEFLLATAEHITKDGYAFVGWYETSDFSSERVTEIEKDNTGNKTFYAKWAVGEVVTTDTISSLDLSSIAADYTLAIVGNVDLSVLATKLKEATETVNLDLFASSATSFADNLFNGCDKIASVVLPETLTAIGSKVFYDCTQLESFTIPKELSEIGTNAFGNCTALTEIDLESGNSEYKVVDGILFSADGLKLIQYPAGKADSSYEIPEGTVSVEDGAFCGNEHITSITVSSTVSKIEPSAFNNCHSLSAISVSSANPVYDDNDGSGILYADTTLVRYPSGKSDTSIQLAAWVTEIGDYAFEGCTTIETITLPAKTKLTTIGTYAFSGCTLLANLNLPESVTTVGGHAFDGCTSNFNYYTVTFATRGGSSIDSVSVKNGDTVEEPTSPTRMGYVFKGWYTSSLLSTTYNFASTTITSDITIYAGWTAINYNITYDLPIGATNASVNPSTYTIETDTITLSEPSYTGYKFVSWSPSNKIETGSTGEKTFTAEWWQPKVTFNANGGTIETSEQIVRYDDESSLSTSTDLGITRAGYYLAGWSRSSVATEDEVEYFDGGTITVTKDTTLYAVWTTKIYVSAASVASLDLSEIAESKTIYVVGSIDSETLSTLATKMNKATVTFTVDMSKSRGITTITNAFANCAKLAKIILPSSATSIDSYAFSNCSALESVTIPSGITSIGSYAFTNCSSLTEAVFAVTSNWYYTYTEQTYSYYYGYRTYTYTNYIESVSDTATAATYLTSNFVSRTWKHN